MNIVFAGPTIRHAEIRQYLDCTCLPPVSHGDILRCLPDKPVALGIIDGYFEGAPSVWHKEILYALDQGVHVFGCSSMGALRAAELYPFGMQGIGQIFEWYKDGIITDDDEVAVLHGPEEVEFITASEPMVNIRATLSLARQQAVISKKQKDMLIDAAKCIFYKQRSWSRVLDSCTRLFNDETLRLQLDDWLKHNKIDLKKRDAVNLLNTMQQNFANQTSQHKANFHFEWTNVWDSAFHEHGNILPAESAIPEIDREIVDQLRLDPERYERIRDKALLGWIAINPFTPVKEELDLKSALKQFRQDHLLGSRSQLTAYMSRANLDEPKLSALLDKAVRVNQIRASAGDIQTGIIEQLKLDGTYLDLLDTVRSKQDMLNGIEEDPDILPPQILAWYFRNRLGTEIPRRLEEHLNRIELDHPEHFYRLITTDYLYWHKQD